MNKTQRKELGAISSKLEQLKSDLESHAGDAVDAYDELSEKAKESDRGEKMCEIKDSLESAYYQLERAFEDLATALQEQLWGMEKKKG